MKEYTLKEWLELPKKEKAKHNTTIMQAADFDDSKIEYQEYNIMNELEFRAYENPELLEAK